MSFLSQKALALYTNWVVELMTWSFVKGIWGLGEKVKMMFEGPLPPFRGSFSRIQGTCTRGKTAPLHGGHVALPCSDAFPLNKYLVRKYHVPGTTWGARNTVVSRTDTTVPFWNLHASGVRTGGGTQTNKNVNGEIMKQ